MLGGRGLLLGRVGLLGVVCSGVVLEPDSFWLFFLDPPNSVVRPLFLPIESPAISSGTVSASTAITKASAAVPNTTL